MDEMDWMLVGVLVLVVAVCGIMIGNINNILQYEEDYGLGSVVTTTAEYEYLTNDSFTGVVVHGEGWRDPALTVRNREGEERRIAIKWLTRV